MSGSSNVILTLSTEGDMLLTDSSKPINRELCWRNTEDLNFLLNFINTSLIPQLQRDSQSL